MTDFDRGHGVIDHLGIDVYESYTLPRGQMIVLPDQHRIMIGVGLEPGVRYWVPGIVRRGYELWSYPMAGGGWRAVLVDAATGKLHDVDMDSCLEVDQFARWIGIDAITQAIDHYNGP